MKQTPICPPPLLGLLCKFLHMGFFFSDLLIGCLCHRLSAFDFFVLEKKKVKELLVGAFLRDTWGYPLSLLFILFCLLLEINLPIFTMKAYF